MASGSFTSSPDGDRAHFQEADVAILDVLVDVRRSMADHSYGERVNMLDHSLQTAARARHELASDDMVLAALLHDVGHLMGDAGAWGLPSHADVGARYLARFLPASVVEPIRLHVAAKRRDADAACSLRRWDDDGKVEDLVVPTVEDHREFLGAAIRRHAMSLSTRWVRDACRCGECRDEGNDQHLIYVGDLDGWSTVDAVVGEQSTNVLLRHRDG